jgi:hypothetical protein
MSARRSGPGPSSVLITPDHVGSVVGIDAHRRTLSAAVADARGGIVASAHFRVSGEGHRALEGWAWQFGRALGDRERDGLGPAHGGVSGRPRR